MLQLGIQMLMGAKEVIKLMDGPGFWHRRWKHMELMETYVEDC
jgi:hypothetical protein